MTIEMVDDSMVRAQQRCKNGTYEPISWVELTDLINRGKLEDLTRSPAALEGYLQWKRKVVATHGSVEKFILTQRLHWSKLTPKSPVPFQCPSDWKVLRNDFPYGVDDGITHLVVWLKTPLEKTVTQELTPRSYAQLCSFIDRTFNGVLECDVLWFLNPPSLKVY